MSTANRTISRPEFLNNGSDKDFRKFIYELLIVSSRMEAVRDRIGNLLGLSGFQYHVLSVISELEKNGPVSVGSVAQVLQARTTYVTMETKKLEKIGLVAKRPNPTDGRSVLLNVTRSGANALSSITPQQCSINDLLFDGLSARDFKKFGRLISSMVVNTDNALALAERHVAVRKIAGNAA